VLVVHRAFPMGSAEYPLDVSQISSQRELEIVHVAEKAGKHVELMVVTAKDPACAVVLAAQKLQASRIVESQSPGVSPEEQARQLGCAWEQLHAPRPALSVEIVPGKSGAPAMFSLGPHAPRLWPADIDLVHRLWRELTERHRFDSQLHHSRCGRCCTQALRPGVAFVADHRGARRCPSRDSLQKKLAPGKN